MLESLILYCLGVFFVYHVLNHSELILEQREWLLTRLPCWAAKAVTCAMCFTFWTTIALSMLCGLAAGMIFTAPPVVLFLALTFDCLNNDQST